MGLDTSGIFEYSLQYTLCAITGSAHVWTFTYCGSEMYVHGSIPFIAMLSVCDTGGHLQCLKHIYNSFQRGRERGEFTVHCVQVFCCSQVCKGQIERCDYSNLQAV